MVLARVFGREDRIIGVRRRGEHVYRFRQDKAYQKGVWQRAGQLGEVADRRRRAALFCSLFVIGLGAGFGTTIMPYNQGSPASSAYNDFASNEHLSPAALLHVGS